MQNATYKNAKCNSKKRNLYFSQQKNFLIVYELDTWLQDSNSDFTLQGCLFGGAKLAKNAAPDKYVYADYGNGLDLPFYLQMEAWEK